MVNRRFLSLLLLLIPASFPVFSHERSIRNFGPEAGPELILIAEKGQNSPIVEGLNSFAARLAEKEPACRISIVIADSLQSDGADFAASIEGNDDCAVIILGPGKKDELNIHAGAGWKTTPAWLLKTITNSASRANVSWELDESRLSLYRIGWKAGNPTLARFLAGGISAALVESDADISGFLGEVADAFSANFSTVNDRHYLVLFFGGKLHYIGEAILAIVMIAASAIILFSLFFFSFLFGKKSDQHLRDLMHVWWLPLLYLIVNVLALQGGQALVTLLCDLRFGNAESWRLLPQIAFLLKILVAWFFITLVVSLNQLIHFPEDSFIYGYIASVVCLINFFVLSSLDFSLTPIFLAMYAISFFASHVTRPAAQTLSIVALAIPFAPYVAALFSEGTGMGPLILGSGVWNVRIALFMMPFQLMMSRIFHMIGLFGNRRRLYVPGNLVVSFVAALAAVALFLAFPAWSARRPLAVGIVQTIDGKGSSVRTTSLARADSFKPEPNPNYATDPGMKPAPSSFITVSSTSRKFLERQLVNLAIETKVPVEKMEVVVAAENGISVYDATQDFRLEDGGRLSRFSVDVPADTGSTNIGFSSDYSSILSVSVHIISRANPWGLHVPSKSAKSDYVLDVTETARIARPGDNGTAR